MKRITVVMFCLASASASASATASAPASTTAALVDAPTPTSPDEPPVEPPKVPEAATPPASPPSPYSLPFQLRSAAAATAIRSDTSFARYENANAVGGFAVATTFLASWKVPGTGAPGYGLAPLVRVAMVNDSPPTGPGGLAIVNPLLGATYALPLGGGFRAAAFFGAAVPVGMGGGDAPDKGLVDARNAGVNARMAMDNALFAVNDLAVIPGVDVAYVTRGFTLQAEATLFQLTRVRGAAAQPETSKTNFTTGLHAGWFATDAISIGAEVRYQRWLNAPIAVDKDTTGALVDNLTFAIGPRVHFPIGEKAWVRPGLAFARGMDKPLAGAANEDVVQLDVPVVF
jgi:hypothetical protein